MNAQEIKNATREELADELAAAGEYTADWETAEMSDLRERVANAADDVHTYTGPNYEVTDLGSGQFVLSHPTSENEMFDTFVELVSAHPICEQSRKCFFGDDA